MSNRSVSAFGPDSGSISKGAVTTGDIPKRGKQSDATPHKNGGVASGNSRPVRAFGGLPEGKIGGLQRDSAKGSPEARQFGNPGETMTDGGNSSGRTLAAVDPYFAADFQGRSGTPDNQSTNRGKGRT